MTVYCARFTNSPCYQRYPSCRCVRCRAWSLVAGLLELPTTDIRCEYATQWIVNNVRVGGLRKRPLRLEPGRPTGGGG
jgi:hypothetical protein